MTTKTRVDKIQEIKKYIAASEALIEPINDVLYNRDTLMKASGSKLKKLLIQRVDLKWALKKVKQELAELQYKNN